MRFRPTAAAAAALTLGIALAACAPIASDPASTSGSVTSVEQKYGLEGLSTPEVIDKLDKTRLADRTASLQASIRPNETILVDESGEDLVLPMPEDELYVAFAPYVTQTHDCTFHAPTSCVGELRSTAAHVSIVDRESGRVYVDDETTTYDNGFVGYWLPRDTEVTISVTIGGKQGSVNVSTRGDDALTCITTLQVA